MISANNKSQVIYLAATIVLSILLLSKMVDYQPLLSQGDHGRDLYIFVATSDGAKPYVDYWWVYGPLMPYYYALCIKVLGTTIMSVLAGKLFLVLISGIIFYLILATSITPLLSFLGTIWFYIYSQDFFHTYNHVGGATAHLAITYLVIRYIYDQRIHYLFGASALGFILCLIKINFGLTALIGISLITLLIDSRNKIQPDRAKKFFYVLTLLIIPLVTLSIYVLLLHPLSIPEIKQCLPYLSKDHPYHSPVFKTIGVLWERNTRRVLSGAVFNRLTHLVFCLAPFYLSFLFWKNKISGKQKKQIAFLILTPALFYVLNLHEFLVSGVFYRSFWSDPFAILLLFIIIGVAQKYTSKIVRIGINALVIASLVFFVIQNPGVVKRTRNSGQYLSLEKTKIFVGNAPEWIKTVEETTLFLDAQLKDDELFFAVPNDPLYYYLTGKKSPSRQLIFSNHINIPPEQEMKIIKELDQQEVNWVVLSSRYTSSEERLGTLGESYCPLIGKYIFDHFEEVAKFGDWENPSGWISPHGTMILKRKTK